MNLLITGAARGLGYELTAEALRRGHRVFAGARSPKDSPKLIALQEAHPELLSVHTLNVADEAQIERLAAELAGQGVRLDGVINNAGILKGRDLPLEQLNMSEFRETMEINLYGPVMVVKHMLPLLPDSGYGAILNISSEAGSISNAYGGDYPYAISKSALNMFSEQVKKYVKARGLRVLSVHPGWIRTDMGGDKAPGDARKSAEGIISLAEGKEIPASPFAFVDTSGQPMKI